MACSSSRTLFFPSTHLLILLFFIHEAESHTCPSSIYFNCPDHAYEGSTLLDFPFTNISYPRCGRCVLTCDNNRTMINCMKNHDLLPRQVSHIFPSNQTIVLECPYDRSDLLKTNPCEAYMVSNASFPSTQSISFTILGESNTSVLICQAKLDDGHCKFCEEIVCGPYEDTNLPQNYTRTCEIIKLPNLALHDKSFNIQYNLSAECQRCLQDGGRCHGPYGGFQFFNP